MERILPGKTRVMGVATAMVTAAVAVALAAGCMSDTKPVKPPPAQSSNTAPPSAAPAAGTLQQGGLGSFRNSLVQSQQQIDSTLASLAALTAADQANLRGAYDKYSDQLARMNEDADTMRREADAMRASRDEYFAKWEQKSSEIDNPTIRASADSRRNRLRNANEKIVATSGEARDAYIPFMKDLQDIKKFLATDLSKTSVADLSEAVKKVNADGAVVKQKIGVVVQTLDSVEAGAQPATKPG